MMSELMLEGFIKDLNEDAYRANFLKYSRKAFRILPNLDKPNILDIGCGSGLPACMLGKLSNSEIIGIDIDESLVDRFNARMNVEGLSDRVKAVQCSFFEMDFPDESFDIILAEGITNIIGFKRALEEWKQLIKPNGFLVIHDEVKKIKRNLKIIHACGYKTLDYFLLPDDAWWIEYFSPLETQIKKLLPKYKNNPEAIKVFKSKQKDINMYKKNPKANRSMFYIIQNVDY